MKTEELEARIKTLEDKITRLEDVEEIKKLQRAYSYYIEHGMWDEIIDLFSDNTESIETSGFVYLGKEGVRRHFSLGKSNPNFLHIVMATSGIVNVDPSGKTAKGRWYGWMCLSVPIAGILRAIFGAGIYENEYVKEDGKWMFKKLYCYNIFHTPYEDGWVKTPDILGSFDILKVLPKPDRFATDHKPYPSGYVVPFHYKHPVTDK